MQVRHRTTGQIYAMKILRKDMIKQDNKVEQIMSERRILETINHPFLIKMHWAFQSVINFIHILETLSSLRPRFLSRGRAVLYASKISPLP